MTCRDVIAFLMDYLALDLPPDQQAEFERHLAECPSCVAYLTTYEETIRLGKASLLQAEAAAPEVPEELVQAILLASRPRA